MRDVLVGVIKCLPDHDNIRIIKDSRLDFPWFVSAADINENRVVIALDLLDLVIWNLFFFVVLGFIHAPVEHDNGRQIKELAQNNDGVSDIHHVNQ